MDGEISRLMSVKIPKKLVQMIRLSIAMEVPMLFTQAACIGIDYYYYYYQVISLTQILR